MNDVKLMVIVGSLRGGSVNGAVARAALAGAPDQVQLDIFNVGGLPFYDGDVEAAGLPSSVQALHEHVARADGLLFFSPEYNGSFPAVTKNAIDWMTRPPKSWEGTAVSMVAASPGPRAGVGVRTHFEALVQRQPVRVFPSLGIGSFGDKMADGELIDQDARAELADFVSSFVEFCRAE